MRYITVPSGQRVFRQRLQRTAFQQAAEFPEPESRTIYLFRKPPTTWTRHRAGFRNIQSDINGPDPRRALARRLQRRKEETPFTRHILIVNYQPSNFTVIQQEDDLRRGLAKVMKLCVPFPSCLLIHVWFCWRAFVDGHQHRSRGHAELPEDGRLFSNLRRKCVRLHIPGLSCLGTKGVKNQKTWRKIRRLPRRHRPILHELVDVTCRSVRQ